MSVESGGLIPFSHESYDDKLFIKRKDVATAIHRIRGLIGIKASGELFAHADAARNIILGMVDMCNEAHVLMLGGVAVHTDLSATFWSSPYTEHAKLVRAGRRASILISHTHEPSSALRMKEMDVTEVAPADVADHLAELNAAREEHGLHTREIKEFEDPTAPKSLYVVRPSADPSMTTIPVSAYAQEQGELVWKRSASYPVTAAEIFSPSNTQ